MKSEGDEDPLFDDDWDASTYLYPQKGSSAPSRPPVTLLVMAVGNNIIFDPSKEELAVADVALAVSVADAPGTADAGDKMVDVGGSAAERSLRLLSIRTIDPPSRLTPPGVPRTTDPAVGAVDGQAKQQATAETEPVDGVWKAPRGGAKVAIIAAVIAKALEQGGVADEVLDGLKAVELG